MKTIILSLALAFFSLTASGQCTPEPGTSNNFYINNVETHNAVQNISNLNSGYADYTANAGSLILQPGGDNAQWEVQAEGGSTLNFGVYVRYNGSNWQLLSAWNGSAHVSGTIVMQGWQIIPEDNIQGVIRVRISPSHTFGAGDACVAIEGETEDYNVTLLGTPGATTTQIGTVDFVVEPEDVVLLYPNPTTGIINIQNKTKIQSIVIYNVLGEAVVNEKPNSKLVNLNIENLPAGIYLADVKTNNGRKTYKIVKR